MALELKADHAEACNNLARLYATHPDPQHRQVQMAVTLAKRAVAQNLTIAHSTLGMAEYRAGNWRNAIDALNKSMQFRNGGSCLDWIVLAMSHWQLEEKDQAQQWYDRAVQWMDKRTTQDKELRRLRSEAEELLGIEHKKVKQKN